MSIKRTSTILTLALLAIFSHTKVAQAQTQKVNIPAIRSDSFSLSQPELTLTFQGLRADSDSVIGIKVDNTGPHLGSIEVGDFVTSPAAVDPNRRTFQAFTAVPKERIRFGDHSITVSSLDQLQGHLYVLLTVPAATSVNVSLNGKTDFAGTPQSGLIIHAGRVVSQEFLGRHQLISRLLVPQIDNPQPEITSSKAGFEASQQALNDHLLSFYKPKNHPESITGDFALVHLGIKIDANGNVIDVTPRAGQEPFLSESIAAIKQARFVPFSYNGSAVQAQADVGITFVKDGRVTSTLK